MATDNIRNPYFIFNGLDSRSMGIEFCNIEELSKPKTRVNEIKVPGRDGVLHEKESGKEPTKIKIECFVLNDEEKRDKICEWLEGSGELILSLNLKKVYRVQIINEIPIKDMMHAVNSFLVTFSAYPYSYNVNSENDFLELTSPAAFLNKGTAKSEPIITIYGTGDCTIFINEIPYQLKNLSGFVTINSEIMEVYKGDENKGNDYIFPKNTEDFFPIFQKGENEIRWSGNVKKIEIQPNWRWV